MEFNDNYFNITDETIINFYRKNNLDFIEMNHIFINILKNLSSNIKNTVFQQSLNQKLTSELMIF